MAVAHRVYARALYDAAKDENRVDAVREELGDFVEAQRQVPELRELLRSPRLDPTLKASALEELLGDGEQLVRNFVMLLAEKGRAGEIEEIARDFERIVSQEEGILDVELTTAVPLSEEEAGEVIAQIEKASGRPVVATRRVDPDLIGGIVLQAGSLRLDASVRGRLDNLRNELKGRAA
jgi:F-type H+-transporting ATPase subunit delta